MTRLVGALAATALLAPTGGSQPALATTVILVRHAEAVANAGNDPELTDAGRARAAALADALRNAGVTAIFTTHYRRTIQTGEPTARAVNAPLIAEKIGGGAGGLDAYVRRIVQVVHEKHAGSTVVIVGHSNTVPALVQAFGGVDAGEIAHDAYDALFVVTTGAPGSGRVIRARYGQ